MGPRRPLVGFLSLDDQPRRAFGGESGPNPALHAWLDAEDPPVFFRFGSMPVQDPAAVVAMITEVSPTPPRMTRIASVAREGRQPAPSHLLELSAVEQPLDVGVDALA